MWRLPISYLGSQKQNVVEKYGSEILSIVHRIVKKGLLKLSYVYFFHTKRSGQDIMHSRVSETAKVITSLKTTAVATLTSFYHLEMKSGQTGMRTALQYDVNNAMSRTLKTAWFSIYHFQTSWHFKARFLERA